ENQRQADQLAQSTARDASIDDLEGTLVEQSAAAVRLGEELVSAKGHVNDAEHQTKAASAELTCLRDELATTDKNTAVRDELIRTTRLLTAARQKLTINRVALRAAQKRVVDLETRVTARTAELDVLARSFTALTDSTCWKITKPLRIAGGWVAEPVRRVARR